MKRANGMGIYGAYADTHYVSPAGGTAAAVGMPPDQDHDADGMMNQDGCIAGSDPTDFETVLRLSEQVQAGEFTMRWPTGPLDQPGGRFHAVGWRHRGNDFDQCLSCSIDPEDKSFYRILVE